MDSGSAVPTLKSGFRETVAANVLTVATARPGPLARTCGLGSARRAEASCFRLLRKARFLAEDNAGRSIAASTAITPITTSNSIRVKARWGIFISDLVIHRVL